MKRKSEDKPDTYSESSDTLDADPNRQRIRTVRRKLSQFSTSSESHDKSRMEDIQNIDKRPSMIENSMNENHEPSLPPEESFDDSSTMPPDQCAEGLESIFFELQSWAVNFALPNTSHLYKLPREEKSIFNNMLKEYGMEEPFEKVISRIPFLACETAPALFATMHLVHHVIEELFMNPFWYMAQNPRTQMACVQEVQDREGSFTWFGEDLYTLYAQFLETDSTLAQIWRRQTIQLYNDTVMSDQHRGTTWSTDTSRYWRYSARSKAGTALSSATLGILLYEPGSNWINMQDTLCDIYERAAEFSIRVFRDCGSFLKFGFIEDSPKKFHHDGTMVVYSPGHGNRDVDGDVDIEEGRAMNHDQREKEEQLDGRSILAIIRPFVYRTDDDVDGSNELICPAQVLLAKDSSDEEL